MTRENREKRERKRFGHRGQLVDIVASTPPARWAFPSSMKYADEIHRRSAAENLACIIGTIRDHHVIDATNIADFTYSHGFDPAQFDHRKLVIKPSFDRMTIECAAPAFILNKDGKRLAWPDIWPSRFGFIIQHGPIQRFVDYWNDAPAGRSVPPGCNMDDAETGMTMIPITVNRSNGAPGYLGMTMQYFLDASGRPTNPDVFCVDHWHHEGNTSEEYRQLTKVMSFAAINAMMFMNCRNITTRVIQPDRHVNRERRKAGLEPFFKYQVIDIEPTKHILRTEGNVDSVGLERAYHICRGHFAHYTKDNPLFGQFAGSVWRPAHARGNPQVGVIVSDYRVLKPD